MKNACAKKSFFFLGSSRILTNITRLLKGKTRRRYIAIWFKIGGTMVEKGREYKPSLWTTFGPFRLVVTFFPCQILTLFIE